MCITCIIVCLHIKSEQTKSTILSSIYFGSKILSHSLDGVRITNIPIRNSFERVYLFILRERGRRGGQRERERQRIPSRLCAVSAEPNAGLSPTKRGITTQAETKSEA